MLKKTLTSMPLLKCRLGYIAAAALMWSASGAVMAFPCFQGYVDGSKSTPVNMTDNNSSDNYICKDGPEGDANDDVTDLNAGTGYFDFTDWLFLDKYDTPDEFNDTYDGGTGPEGIINISGLNINDDDDIVGGNWNFLIDPWSTYANVLLVLKDGKYTPPSNGVYWSAYSVTPNDTSGDWVMPDRNLSHISVYGRGQGSTGNGTSGGQTTSGGTTVAEPNMLALLGAGLLGGVLAARRRRRNSV